MGELLGTEDVALSGQLRQMHVTLYVACCIFKYFRCLKGKSYSVSPSMHAHTYTQFPSFLLQFQGPTAHMCPSCAALKVFEGTGSTKQKWKTVEGWKELCSYLVWNTEHLHRLVALDNWEADAWASGWDTCVSQRKLFRPWLWGFGGFST